MRTNRSIRSRAPTEFADDVLDRAYAWLDERPTAALALLEPFRRGGDAVRRGRARVCAMRVALRGGDLDRALRLFVEARVVAGETGAPVLSGELAVAHARLALCAGSYEDALSQAELAVRLGDGHCSDRPRLEARSHRNLVLGHMQDADTEHGDRELIGLAIELGRPFEEVAARNDRAQHLLERGRHREARDEIDRACALARRLHSQQRAALGSALARGRRQAPGRRETVGPWTRHRRLSLGPPSAGRRSIQAGIPVAPRATSAASGSRKRGKREARSHLLPLLPDATIGVRERPPGGVRA